MLEGLFEPTFIFFGLTSLSAIRITKDKLSFILVLFSILELRVRVNIDVTSHCHKMSHYNAVMVTLLYVYII